MTANLVKEIFGELFAKLISFSLEEEFLQDLGESLEVFYNLEEGEEFEFDPTEEFLFLSWFLFDDSDANGYTLSDEFIKRNADNLTLQETQICKALKETHLTLLQVEEVIPRDSIILKDLFLGEKFSVDESVDSVDEIPANSLLVTRVLRLGETRYLVGAGIFLDPALKEHITTFMTEQYKDECEDGNMMSFKDFLKLNGELLNWWIRAYEKGMLYADDSESPKSEKAPEGEDK